MQIPFDANKHHRRNVRLCGYDYAQNGAYMVTVCTAGRECLFGEISGVGEMMLNTLGCVVEDNWFKSATIRKAIILDTFVVMPNHIHGIVMMIGAPLPQSMSLFRPPRSLGSFVAGFKSAVTSQINQIRETPYMPVWQRSFHDKIIWNQSMLDGIRIYVESNPTNWASDQENLSLDN